MSCLHRPISRAAKGTAPGGLESHEHCEDSYARNRAVSSRDNSEPGARGNNHDQKSARQRSIDRHGCRFGSEASTGRNGGR